METQFVENINHLQLEFGDVSKACVKREEQLAILLQEIKYAEQTLKEQQQQIAELQLVQDQSMQRVSELISLNRSQIPFFKQMKRIFLEGNTEQILTEMERNARAQQQQASPPPPQQHSQSQISLHAGTGGFSVKVNFQTQNSIKEEGSATGSGNGALQVPQKRTSLRVSERSIGEGGSISIRERVQNRQ